MICRHFILFFVLILVACQRDKACVHEPESLELMQVPAHFPDIDFPLDNTYTKERWALGKKLFFDPIMSRDSSISCASCHNPNLAFTDGKIKSEGVFNRVGSRNTPTLANVAYHPYFLREGGVPTLEFQAQVPIQEHAEFDFNILQIADRMERIESYVSMSQEAYDRNPDAFVITRALANFQRSLISGQSRYDAFLNDETCLSDAEKRGHDLFFSDRASCSSCHSDIDFTNFAFENNGLYQVYEDAGRFLLTNDSIDFAMFKVPTLRNLSVTAPYMHDGSLENLEEVVTHYNNGGSDHLNKNALVRPLGLTDQEQADLVAFLHSLTDYAFIDNVDFRP